MSLNEITTRAVNTVIDSTAVERQNAENIRDVLIIENATIEDDRSRAQADIQSLRAQLNSPQVVSEVPSSSILGDSVDAGITAVESGNNDAVATPESTNNDVSLGTDIVTSGGGKISTNVGEGGDEVLITDPNGQQIKVHGDPHLDFQNDGRDEAHFGDNSQIKLSDGSKVHLNSVKEGDAYFTRGIFIEDVNGTITQVGRSADDKEHLAEAKQVDKSAISTLGSNQEGAGIFGIAKDGTAMIESNGAWHELKAESFDEFKADMTFDKQIGGEVNAEVGLGLQNGEAAFGETDIATEGNSLIQEQIDRLEGEVAVHDNQINSNEEQISDATSQAEALITEETALNERSSPELDGTDAVNNASINELDSKKTTDTAKPEDQHLLASYSNENGRVIRDNQIAEV
jgi:hypothetical protein